jgi:hypothetical protein
MLYHYIIVYMYSCTDIPTIGTPHSNITAKVSTDVILAVTVGGTYPQISSVVWTKNGNDIDVDGRKYVGGSVQKTNLIPPNLKGHIELANTDNDFSIQFCQYLADFFGVNVS